MILLGDTQLQCILYSGKNSAPVNAIALVSDEKARTDGTGVDINVLDLSLAKFRQWVSAADQMSDIDVNNMFYEDAQKNLVAIESEDIFHMALIQMIFESSHADNPNKTFEFIVTLKGKGTPFTVVTYTTRLVSGIFPLLYVRVLPTL